MLKYNWITNYNKKLVPLDLKSPTLTIKKMFWDSFNSSINGSEYIKTKEIALSERLIRSVVHKL